ncbi:hypothetical protein BH09GEM1_BH09GEM1_28960 [soil metagenome]
MTDTLHAVEATEPHRDKINRALRNKKRLSAVEQADVLDAAGTMPALNRAVRVAAHAVRAPIVQLNVLTDRLLVPIAVHADSDGDADADANIWSLERPVSSSYCRFVVWKQGMFLIEDAHEDPLVRHRHATRELNIGSYIGVPIHASAADAGDPAIIGTLCAIDHGPRQWTAGDVQALSDIAIGSSDYIAARIRGRSEVRGHVQRADRVLEAAGVAVIATDARGVMTYANPAAARMLGYTADELHGRDQHALMHHSHPDGRKYLERNCPNYIARKAGRLCHATNDTLWKSDGTPITVDSTMTPIFERGELVGTVLSFIDVTDRRDHEEAAQSARRAADVANRAKTELLGAISHELRIPLDAIADRAQHLEETLAATATAEQLDELQGIRRDQQHLVGLIDNVVHFSRLEVEDH